MHTAPVAFQWVMITADRTAPRPVSPANYGFLVDELHHWERDGLVDADTAAAIRARYVESRRFGLAQIVLGLGSAFVVIGLIWLVASNLDQLSPLLRFGVVAAIWLGLTIGSERLEGIVAAAGRLLAAGAFGAVVFQAAQSLQVPAYEPRLLLAWGLGATLYAYAVRSLAALVIGLGALTWWFVWQIAQSAHGILGFITALVLAAVVMTAVAALHPRDLDAFAGVWRFVGALLLFAGLFGASLPMYDKRGSWPPGATIGVLVAVGLAAVAMVRARARSDRLELAGLAGLAVTGVLLALWWPRVTTGGNGVGADALTPQMWLRTGASLLVYLAAVAWIAVVGEWRSSPALTALAMAAVVLYVTVQSWAVFAPIISGATLFLVVGVIMLTTGVLAERTRRRLARDDADTTTKSTDTDGATA